MTLNWPVFTHLSPFEIQLHWATAAIANTVAKLPM